MNLSLAILLLEIVVNTQMISYDIKGNFLYNFKGSLKKTPKDV